MLIPQELGGEALWSLGFRLLNRDTSRETGYGSTEEAEGQNQLLPLGGGLVLV